MGRRHKRESIAMDLTPLIDVVFLLLIFFLVTSSFKKEQLALLVKLPKSEQGAGTDKKTDQLTIELSDNDVAVNGKKTTIEELPASFANVEKTVLVNLRIDGEVRYQRLVKILDLLQLHKLENVSLITDKEAKNK